jgi:excisionase family DNA binding protein
MSTHRPSRPSPYESLAEALAEILREAVTEAVSRVGKQSGSEENALVGVPEAARRLNLGETTTKREIAAGRLRSVLVGRRRLVPVDAITEFAQRLTPEETAGNNDSGTAS